jgi:galactose mutarotase-like enzyme
VTESEPVHSFSNGRITAIVKADGAELVSLRNASGREHLWQAGAAWPRHAPVLFPIVGRLKGDRLHHRGRAYPMGQHGFARDRRFDWIRRDAQACRLVLRDDEASRAIYPFAFALEIAYRLTESGLAIRYAVTNPGRETLPCSLGAHPAFRWPLREGTDRADCSLDFSKAEPEPVRRLNAGLLTAERHPSPIQGRHLPLDVSLFAQDALILDRVRSRRVRYGAPGGPGLEIAWRGFPQLGLWSKAGGDFLCIEPWHGFASPEDFDGEFRDKPGLLSIAPDETVRLEWRIRLLPESA